MLQQTQTDRVVYKYQLFLKTFPTFKSLAKSPLNKVLKVWQGLGYNRRAVSLHKTAQIIVYQYQGKLPESVDELIELPGIGHYTASAICAFAFNQPTTFIETNIRRIYIHFFFQKKRKVDDKDILPLVEQTLDKKNPRVWYYALMDYGVMLKKRVPNPNRKSTHYAKQSKFEGSNRQIRGMILKALLKEPKLTESKLVQKLNLDKDKVKRNLIQLKKEGFITTG
jgi:A/G-specific adenine glycosylase